MGAFLLLALLAASTALVAASGLELDQQEGHLKPFGVGRPNRQVEEVSDFPSPQDFFEKFVLPMKPLVIRGASSIAKAVSLWTDEYFLEERSAFLVNSEPFQKQVVHQPVIEVPFNEFVSTYNRSGRYMVNPVPPFLA